MAFMQATVVFYGGGSLSLARLVTRLAEWMASGLVSCTHTAVSWASRVLSAKRRRIGTSR